MSWGDRSYAEWQVYLAGGRKKYERTLYDRGWRVRYANKYNRNGDIEITCPWWSSQDAVITIHPDDTKTIDASFQVNTSWGGTFDPLRAYSVRFSIYKYTGIEVVQRNYKYRIFEVDAGYTPPKIQKCRQCKGSGLADTFCTVHYCYHQTSSTPLGYICEEHGVIDPQHVTGRGSWHIMPCSHNSYKNHTIPKDRTCYYCSGSGKRDYGSKRISLAWDGSPLKVKDGKIVRQPLTDLERIVESYVGPTTNV